MISDLVQQGHKKLFRSETLIKEDIGRQEAHLQ